MMLGLGNELRKSGAPSAPFTVDTLSEVITWLKADTGVTETSVGSGLVQRWRDNIGQTDWISTTNQRQPIISGTGVNAHVLFDSTDRLYQKEHAWNNTDHSFDFDFPHDVFDVMNLNGTSGSSTFIVYEYSSSLVAQTTHIVLSENHFIDDGAEGSPFPQRTAATQGSSSGEQATGGLSFTTQGDFVAISGIEGGGAAFNDDTDAGDEFPADQKFLITIEYAGGTNGEISFRVNGVDKTVTNGKNRTCGEISVGNLGSNSVGMQGKLFEFVNCHSKLSSGNRNKVEQYLMDRHSIS